MKTYVDELQANQEITTFFFVRESAIRKTKGGKNYLAMKLSDKTGAIETRVWDIPKELDPTTMVAGKFVKVQANVTEYKDELQLNVFKIRFVEESDEYDVKDFFPQSKRDPNEMFDELMALIRDMDDDELRNLTSDLLIEHSEKMLMAPGGKSMHHAYFGGLLEHVLSMTKFSKLVAFHYNLDKDLLIASCALHDLGKLDEMTYSYTEGFGYSTEGSLLGHIVIGLQKIEAYGRMRQVDRRRLLELMHMVASHHGLLEYGSPRVPMMKEAIALHMVDNIDAKMNVCDNALDAKGGVGDFTDWIKAIDAPLLRPVPKTSETSEV